MPTTLFDAYKAVPLKIRIIAVAYKFDIGLTIDDISTRLAIEQDVLRFLYRSVMEEANFSTRLEDLLNALESMAADVKSEDAVIFDLSGGQDIDDYPSEEADYKHEFPTPEEDDIIVVFPPVSRDLESHTEAGLTGPLIKVEESPNVDEEEQQMDPNSVIEVEIEATTLTDAASERGSMSSTSDSFGPVHDESDFEPSSSATSDDRSEVERHQDDLLFHDDLDAGDDDPGRPAESQNRRRRESQSSGSEDQDDHTRLRGSAHKRTSQVAAGAKRPRPKPRLNFCRDTLDLNASTANNAITEDDPVDPSVLPPKKRQKKGPKGARIVQRRPEAVNAYYTESCRDSVWYGLMKARQDELSHVGRIHETDAGRNRVPACARCVRLGHECREYTVEGQERWDGSLRNKKCARCRYAKTSTKECVIDNVKWRRSG